MRSPGGAHGGRITGQKRFRQGHWGVGDGWELKPPPTISLMAFQSILIELSYAKCVFPRLNCRKAGISFGCPHLAGGGGRKDCGYSNAGPEAKNSFRLSTKCSFHRGESRGSHAYLEPPCQGQALEEEGDGGGQRGKEREG